MPAFATATVLAVREVRRSAVVNLVTAMPTANLTDGVRFNNDPGRTFLRVKNTGGSPVTATADTPGTVDNLAVADLPGVSGATTGDVLFGPFSGYYHQPGTQEVWVTFSGACTVDAFHLSNE